MCSQKEKDEQNRQAELEKEHLDAQHKKELAKLEQAKRDVRLTSSLLYFLIVARRSCLAFTQSVVRSVIVFRCEKYLWFCAFQQSPLMLPGRAHDEKGCG